MPLIWMKFEAQGKSHLVELDIDPVTGGYVIMVDGEPRLPRGRGSLCTYLSESITISDRVCTVKAFSLLWGLYERYSISEVRQKIR